MSFSPATDTGTTASRLEGPELVWTEEMIARERGFRDELIIGPPVTMIAGAFSKDEKSLESAVKAFCKDMMALVRHDDANPGDVEYYTGRMTSEINACQLIDKVRIVEESFNQAKATRSLWWSIKGNVRGVRWWASGIFWAKRDGKPDPVCALWKRAVNKLSVYEKRLSLMLEPLPVLGRVTLSVESRRIVGTGDHEPALSMKLSEATLSDAETGKAFSRDIFEGSRFAIGDEYRNIDDRWLRDNVSCLRLNLHDVNSLVSPTIAEPQPDIMVSPSA
jgi:hypothetical protein